jgi:hypothetical protein
MWERIPLSGREDNQISAGGELNIRKCPLGESVHIIRQIPPLQLDGIHTGVVDLNPVLLVPIFVVKAIHIHGHELAYADWLLCQDHSDRAESKTEHNEKSNSSQMSHIRGTPPS